MFIATGVSKLFMGFSSWNPSRVLLSLIYRWRNGIEKDYFWSFEDIAFYLVQQKQDAHVALCIWAQSHVQTEFQESPLMMSLTLLGITYTRTCFIFALCLSNTVLLLSLVLHLFRSTSYDLCFYPFLLHVKDLTIHGSIDTLVRFYHPPPLGCAMSSLMPQRLLQGTLKYFALCIMIQAAVCFLFLMVQIIVASQDHRETWGINRVFCDSTWTV